jgi:hypothetical protein
MSNTGVLDFEELFEMIRYEYEEEIAGMMGIFSFLMLNRVAWAKTDGGFMPVKDGFAINSVSIRSTNTAKLEIELGSNIKYMWSIEKGRRDINYPVSAPFEKGIAYALKHDIYPMMEEIHEQVVKRVVPEFYKNQGFRAT